MRYCLICCWLKVWKENWFVVFIGGCLGMKFINLFFMGYIFSIESVKFLKIFFKCDKVIVSEDIK